VQRYRSSDLTPIDSSLNSRILGVGSATAWALVGTSLLVQPAGPSWTALWGGSTPWGLPWLLATVALVAVIWPGHPVVAGVQVSLLLAWVGLSLLHEPRALLDPFGPGKTLPWFAAAVTPLLLARGHAPDADRLLLVSVGLPWITEGALSKIILQTPLLLSLTTRTGLSFGHPSAALRILGTAQVIFGAAILGCRGASLRALLVGSLAGTLGFTVLLTWVAPRLWMDALAPLAKNVPIAAVTWVLFGRARAFQTAVGGQASASWRAA
jgi:hypothetical protein